MSLAWQDTYSVGVERFDRDHQQLFRYFSELHESFIAGSEKQKLSAILDRLVAYTVQHFAAEEAVLKAAGYPALAEHVKEHQAFTQRIGDFAANHKAGNVVLTSQVMKSVRSWLTDHIMKSDQSYGAFLAKTGAQVPTVARAR